MDVMERDPNMLRNLRDICKVLGIGRRRFERYFRQAEPPMPVRFDGFSYIADKEELLAWRREFTKRASE